MVKGWVSEEWAKKHAPRWLAEVKASPPDGLS
jgi:cytochrome b subunit of formate dehydrogenase